MFRISDNEVSRTPFPMIPATSPAFGVETYVKFSDSRTSGPSNTLSTWTYEHICKGAIASMKKLL